MLTLCWKENKEEREQGHHIIGGEVIPSSQAMDEEQEIQFSNFNNHIRESEPENNNRNQLIHSNSRSR